MAAGTPADKPHASSPLGRNPLTVDTTSESLPVSPLSCRHTGKWVEHGDIGTAGRTVLSASLFLSPRLSSPHGQQYSLRLEA